MKQDTTRQDAIHTALRLMSQILERATHDVQEATGYIAQGEQNVAIGTMVCLEDALDQAMSLYGAIVAMHRFKL